MLMWLFIFVLNIVIDVTWAKFTINANRLNAHGASAWSVAIVALGGWSVISYVQDPWLLIPAAAGAYIGTWLTIDFQRFMDRKKGRGSR